MRKVLISALGFAAAACVISAQDQAPAAAVETGKLADVSIWVLDPLIHALDDAAPAPDAPGEITIFSAKGEFENGQFVMRADKLTPGLKLSVSPLKGPGGAVLERVTVNPVGRLRMEANTGATPIDDVVAPAPFNLPDVLMDIFEFDLHPGYAQPVWITVWTPRDAKPGEYTGSVVVESADSRREIPVKLRVFNVAVPKKCHVDTVFWINMSWLPAALQKDPVARKEYWRLMLRDMVEHRQNVLVAPGFLSYAHSVVYPGDPIKIIEEDGRWRLDCAEFDEFVQMAFDEGFEYLIPGHPAHREGGWHGKDVKSFPYNIYDAEGKKARQIPRLDAFDPAFKETVTNLFALFYAHLEAKGWKDKVLFHHLADEPLPDAAPAYNHAANIIRDAVPGLKVLDATLARGIDSGGYIAPMNLWWSDREFYKEKEKEGSLVWQYTCRWPRGRYPNFFPDYPLLRSVMVNWFNWRYAIPGYLNWNYNCAQPPRMPQSLHQPGSMEKQADALDFCAYVVAAPDRPLPSVRWEANRDGREDFELLRIVALRSPETSRAIVMEAMPDPIRFVRDAPAFRKIRERLLTEAEIAAASLSAEEIEGGKIVWDYLPEKEFEKPLPAVDRGEAWKLAYESDFKGADIPADWKVLSGEWQASGGWLTIPAGADPKTGGAPDRPKGGSLICVKEFDGDMRLEYECQCNAKILNQLSCYIHCSEPPSITGYGFGFGTDENAFCKIAIQESQLCIREDVRIERGKTHKVVAQRDGGVLSLFVDGRLAAVADDILPQNGKGRGQFAFFFGGDSKLRNVRLYTKPARK